MPGQPAKPFSEDDIRPAGLMAAKQSLVDQDRRYLLERRQDWVAVDCPACARNEPTPFGEKNGIAYVRCRHCGTVYTNPRPSQDLLHRFYSTSQNYQYWNQRVFPATEGVRRERIFRPRAQRLAEYCRQLNLHDLTLLEVGAAFGLFCEEAWKTGLFRRIIAVEPTPDLAQTCRDKGLEVIEAPVEQVTLSALADVVAAFEVVEHLFSPQAFFQQCQRLLRPGGLLVVTCPNVNGFDVATLGLVSGTFDHEHLNYFHALSLSALISRCGFEIVDVSTPGRLDAAIVRKHALRGEVDLSQQPFLIQVLSERWDELGAAFQDFLAGNRLSSHLWVIARKTHG